MNFASRAYLSELMDEPCTYEEFRACLRDLAAANRWTFTCRPTLDWLTSLNLATTESIHIVDVGCGGGDMLRRIEQWGKQNGVATRLTGIDLNPYSARAAREITPRASGIEWITGDAFSYEPPVAIDFVISSLFTHHLPDEEIVHFLKWMEQVARRGWFINDLHRERMPYYGFWLLSRVMRWHPFVQHDGPVSIRRAFRHEDWKTYLAKADVAHADVVTYRPARLCVQRVKA